MKKARQYIFGDDGSIIGLKRRLNTGRGVRLHGSPRACDARMCVGSFAHRRDDDLELMFEAATPSVLRACNARVCAPVLLDKQVLNDTDKVSKQLKLF